MAYCSLLLQHLWVLLTGSSFDWETRWRGNMANVNSNGLLWCIHSLCCQFLGMAEGGPNLANRFGWHAPYAKQLVATQLPFNFFLFASVPLTRLKHSYMYNTPESAHQLCRVPFQAVDLMCLIGCAVLQFQFMLVMRPHPPPPSSDSFIDSSMMLPIRHVASNIITNCNC